MSLRSQRRKAMVLSVLMVMLAQSAYSQYYQGWYPPVLEEEPEKKFVNPVVCASETRASGTAINVNQVLGNDSYAGTSDCPMKSLSAAVNEAVNDDEVIIHSGLYHDNVSIDGIDNLVIRAATGATVIFDGTKSITDDLGGVWSTADANGIQEVTLSQDGWQLFLAHEEQVPARWPNAQFSDETVFNRSYMAEGTLTNSNNAYTIGWLTDAGPETGVHTGLNETINATGLDPVGAIAVMNLGSFRSNSREITGWNSANGTFSYDGTGVGWKAKHHAYFLEGKRELIDTEGEWWYNNSDNRLHYKTPSSQDANDLDLRVKVQPFAISVDNSDGVTIQGIDFFGTTVNFNNCDGCSFTNSTMQYPSTSKRGLGIAGESEDDRWMTRFYRCKNTFVDKISITNTDGGALEFHGSGGQSHNNTVNNSYFHAIDWSAADQKGLMTTIYEGGRDMYFTNNSVHLTGASSVLSIGDAPKVFYNRVWDVGHLQTDGAVVQVMQGEAPGAEIAYNWIHDVIKYGARFDAPIGQAGEGRNGTMHHNVIWNAAGGLMVKGDYHNIHNNTIFNSTGKNDIIFLTDGGINNKNSTLHYNAVDAMADHRSDDVFANPLPNGSHWNNWNGYLQGYDGMFEARNQISCAIYDNGSLYCWGRNDHGQLGLGSTSGREDAPQYVDFGAGRTVTSLGIGSSGAEGWEPNSHTCVVLDNGSLMCWGANGDGQLGIGNVSSNGVWEPSFVNVGSGVTVISVATASSSTCALLSNQSVKCWGRNNFGQLGLGNISNNDVLTPQFVNFIGSSKPVSLHSGMNSYCAKLDNGSIACWGRNIDGELGLGNTTNQNKPVTLSTPAGRTVSTVSLGKRFMCLSYDNGSVACVGINNENQLGQGGGGASQSSLLYVKGIEMIAHRVDAAQEVACAHLVNGSVVCWGKDEWGLFGNSSSSYTSRTASTATEYVNFGATRTAASISVSMRHSCAILDNGDLACWGRNHKSQLGFGNITQQFMPVVVTNVSSIRQIQIHELLVDPANEDFRPKWGSHLQQLSAGAYDAGDINPWTAGISWTYSAPSAPVAGCMLDYADNYDSDAIVSDGSCTFSSYTPPSSLDLRLHVDPANSGSYSGSGTDLVDMSTYGNDGTIDGAAWEANRTRFYYDGSCSGSTAPANQAGTYVCDEVTFAETNDHDPDANGDWSVSVWMNATTVQHSVIIGKWNGGGSASDLGYIIRIGSDNKLYTSVGTTSGSSAVSTSRISIDEDRWYHLVMVADAGNILRLYADGVNVVNASLSGSGSIRNTTSGISIGSYNAGEYNQPFDGNIGEVMIFADALNSTTINQMYNASKGAYSNTTSLSYSDSSYTFVKGQPYNLPLTISNGDVTTSYTLTGSLPNGMSFGSDNGTIWGTPTADMSSATYTVTANNSAGSFSTSFQIQVMSAPSGLTYSPSSMTLEKGTTMTTNTPTYSGSAPSSWAINATLPTGLSFDTSSGAISGTPTVTQTTAKTYTITATNSHGSASTSVSITINDQVPVISYTSPVEISNNREMTTATPTNTGGAVTSWVITPSLPTGLSFGTTNGSIWGTPENVTSNAMYTVYANNSGGSGTTTVALNMVWTLTPSVEGAFITRNNSIGSDITWEWDYNSTTAVSGAACGILPALPTGLSLTTGTCAITGTPTSTAINTTYTIWANISGESFSGQVWLEVGLNAPIPSYSPNTYTFTKNTTISTINSVNTGGEVTTWDLETSLPSGLNLGATNGSIWGTPDALSSTATYTVWANNSAGSASTTITLTVNDIAPSISYSVPYLKLLKGSAMTALTVTNSGGAIISCSVSPSLPNGMSLSSTCELSGAPTVSTTNISYTVTATNTGGSDSTTIYIEVLDSGGTMTVTPTHSTGSVNATLASIAASYSHSLTIPSWTSGVTNTSGMLNNSASVAGTAIAAWDNGALAVAWTRPIYGGTTQHVLALSVYDGSSWTTQDLDTASRTGYRPSIAIDNQGALHIAYIDRDNTNLRYATNASGTWVLTTVDNSSANPVNDWVRTGIAIDNQGHVHIIHPVDGSSSIKLLNYTTNVSGSFVSTTISDTTNDDGKYASIAIAGNGSLHISVYRDSGGSDLRYYTDESGVWTNETVRTGDNYGKDSVIGLNSKDEVVIAYRKDDSSDDIYISVGNRGSWAHSLVAKNRYASYLAMAIDSNDDIHISSHNIRSQSGYCCNKDLEYFTNSSGSWVRTTLETGVGGIFGTMVIDSNDDVHIAHADNIGGNDLLYATVKGSGKGLAVNPVFSVSPGLPNGLILNWKTGEITGAPTVASANTTYTLTAIALGATTTTTFTLHVTGAPGEISYSDISATNGVTISPVTPTITTNATTGSVSTWEINASLPTGLTFETSNGTIWGTPTQITAGAVFTIWANNSVGSQSTTINITIIDVVISSITYSTENFTLSLNHTITSSTPSTSGGTATSFAIHPSLPTGLAFDNSTGKISGTPEVLQTTAVTYTIWANNSGGSFSDQINVTVNDHSPAPINFYGENITLNYNQTLTPITIVETEPDLIAAGEDHSCAIKADGTVRCWGEGSSYRLGYGNNGDRSAPTATASLGTNRTAVDITAGDSHTCVILDDGTVSCWGSNNYGELGDGTTTTRSTPTQTLSLGRPAIAIEAGFDFTCALMDNGSIMCWGRNHYGQLGRGYTNTSSSSQPTPMYTVPLPTGRHAVSIDIGHYHVCAVLDNGSIACWGPGNSNRLGTGSVANQNTPTVIQFFDASNPAVDVALGRYSGCGLLENGSVTCWGKGWLGTGNQNQVQSTAGNIWPDFGTGRTAVKVELGRWHNCALLDNSNVKCWGADGTQQMGNGGGTTSQTTPKKVNFATGVVPKEITSGHWHTCVVSQTHEMYCWGDGASGKLGDGASTNNAIPGKVGHFSGTNPVKAHGEVTSWAIHPTLPTGLNLGSNNGTLYGAPTASLSQTNFTIYANNSGGSAIAYFNLTVNHQVPSSINYIPENLTMTKNTASTDLPLVPSITGPGVITSWELNNTILPSGVSFGSSNGTLYGTATQLWSRTSYKVWANNSGGSVVAYFNLTVNDQIPLAINYNPENVTMTNNTASSDLPLVPSIFGPGSIVSWELNNTNLPTGISFGSTNGTLYGTATQLWTRTSYKVWANNTGGSVVAYFNLTVNDQVPSTINYNPENVTLTNNTAPSDLPLVATITGSGAITSWELNNTNLPTGISFGSDNGTLYGTATQLWTRTTYKVWANNSGGSVVAYFNLTVNDQVPSDITYNPENVTLTKDTTSSDLPLAPGITGSGDITSWELNNTNLPSGISFSITNGTLYGTATQLWTQTSYLVWANNTGGSVVAYFNLTVNDQVPSDITYTPENVTLTKDTTSSDLPLVPSITGSGLITSWELNNTNLPNGISFGSLNGTLYGTATQLWTRTAYVVYANNTGGSIVAYFNLTVNDQIPTGIIYSPEDVTLTNNTASSDLPLVPTITGSGSITSWELNNTNLPVGISFGSGNGTLYGTATQLWTRTSYKVWANNTGGSVEVYFNLTVVDQVPSSITYSPENVTMTNSIVSSDLPLIPSITGPGLITSWELNNTNLPAGISFGITNGTLYGTATQLWNTTAYKVWANNSGGSVNAYFNLTVVDQVPTLSYSAVSLVLTKGSKSSNFPLNATLNGSGTITSWAISAPLPAGLTFGFSNGTIWGIATELLTTATSYTIWANNSGGSTTTSLTLTINDVRPGPFEYIPENNTWINNTEINLEPQFVNRTTGNASTWRVADINNGTDHSGAGERILLLVGDVIYFDAFDPTYGYELWAYNTSNTTTWRVTNIHTSGGSDLGDFMSLVVHDTIYFSANDGSSGHELWAHNTSNESTWRVADIYNGSDSSYPGSYFEAFIGDTLYFSANDGNSGYELWAHNTSNISTWKIADIHNGSDSSNPGSYLSMVVNNTIYFSANDGSTGHELWAYNTSNETIWQAANMNPSTGSSPGFKLQILVGDTIYFDADTGAGTGRELWAHNISNLSTWRVTDIASGSADSWPGTYMEILVGDTLYFSSYEVSSGYEMWAHNTSNLSTWRVKDISSSGSSNPGQYMSILVGETIYFSADDGNSGAELWAHNTFNNSTWRVKDISSSGSSNPGQYMSILLGDTIYFSANDGTTGTELWAHDTSNGSTWRVADIYTGSFGSAPGYWSGTIQVENTIYFSANDGVTGHEFWAHQPSRIDYNTNTGGDVITWALNASLPNGVSFSTNNGTFYGTPTQLWPQKSYMVWANNSGGSRIGYLNITVVDNVPSFVYPIENLTLTNNTADANLPLVPTLTGPGVITSWELNNSNLPNGISFGTANGTLYGIATQLWTTTSYKVWANNSGGSVVAHFNLTVIDQIPSSIIYNPENVTITNNTASSDLPLSPSITGSGLITSWELNNTNLPVGVSFGSDNGTLYGIATQLWPTTSYMVWANNTGGTVVSYFNLTVIDQVPTISYSPNDLVLTKNQTSPDLPLSPLVTGTGDITSWELNNTLLPAGISFGANNGTFYGTANQLWNRTSYMVWGNNSGGATVAYLNITVVDQVPAISYSPANLILTNNTNSTHFPLAPTLTGPGDIVTWEMVGILPNGINFGNNNGTFWGKPTQLLNQTQYTVWANNTGGSAVTYLNITVIDQLPLISYNPENLTLLNNTQSPTLPLGPTLAGPGIILEWGISDGLPTGLNFGSDNGTLWGIPTERMNKTMFTIWANNTGGSVTANINITVLHQVPVFSYSVLDLILVNNTIMNNVTPTITGGEIVSWEASPDMPVGINIDEKGNISGLPTVVQNRTMYMIWANNTGGSHIVYLNITIYDVTAGLDYIPENLILTRNVSMTDLSPVYTGIVDNWDIYPQLPTGLSFANGTISGTPENNMTKVMYTIYANNTGGSISHTINITVLEPIMDFEYIPANVTLVNNTASTDMPMVPILYNDGVAETWEISPILPSGLNFSSTNGTISGTPTKLQINPVNYTIWANNSGGVGYAIISITIVDQVPNLSYPHDLELTNNTNSSDLPMLPILDGAGEIVTWEISPQLPTGLNFSSDDGSISGIATKLSIRKQYTVWANNSGGSSMARFNITVVDQVPTDIGYNYEILVLTRNDSNEGILPLSPNLVGPGEITSWEINGTLINGLYFGTDNGTIWGVPEDLHFEWQNYTIYGNNSGGSVISKVAIMVNDQLPTIAYEAEQYVLRNDTEMIPISATHGGGQYVTLAIHPELPYGMIFNFNNGTISGHPTEITGIVNYTIWANNSGGSTQTNILITVEEKPPEISYPFNEMVIYVGHEIDVLPLLVNSSGGNVETYSITPSLPDGLFFGVSNGTIWGVATVDMETTQYTITAQNYVATDTVTINLTSYNYSYGYELDPIWVTKGNFMEIITPLYIIPGATYDVIPNLPKGMSINPNSGVISGRPNIALNLKNYTLTATVDEYILVVEMKLGILQDTDLDGMPDELPDGDNLQNLIEDFDDDNDNVDDQIELDCGSDPYDSNDTPVFNSNGNCAPEPEGLGFMICIPILLFLIMVLVVILATRRRDDVSINTEKRTKSSQKKIGKENWMTDYRIDEDGTEWGEDEEGTWWKRKKDAKKWKEWDNELPSSNKK